VAKRGWPRKKQAEVEESADLAKSVRLILKKALTFFILLLGGTVPGEKMQGETVGKTKEKR